MHRIIFCSFLKKNAIGQESQVYPGKLGKKIYHHISQEAWDKWKKKQTIFINENRLDMSNFQDRKKIEKEMKAFLFSE